MCVILLNVSSDKRLFESKRKDQLNALKNLVELNDVNQQYKIIDIMLKGLFKVCVCVQVYISWWGLKPEYTQTHGDSCHGGDLN